MQFDCQTCGESFKQITKLKSHQMLHEGEKTYCCEVCSKLFSKSSNLQSHVRTHTGEKPYRCNICDKLSPRMNSLRSHIMKVHTIPRSEADNHIVYVASADKQVTEAESREHAAEYNSSTSADCVEDSVEDESYNPYHYNQPVVVKENVYYKTFQETVRLNKELTGGIDSDLKKIFFTCKLCSKTMAHKSNMEDHVRSHSGIKLFECKLCGKGLSRKQNLVHHLKHVHFLDHSQIKVNVTKRQGPGSQNTSRRSLNISDTENEDIDHCTDMNTSSDQLFVGKSENNVDESVVLKENSKTFEIEIKDELSSILKCDSLSSKIKHLIDKEGAHKEREDVERSDNGEQNYTPLMNNADRSFNSIPAFIQDLSSCNDGRSCENSDNRTPYKYSKFDKQVHDSSEDQICFMNKRSNENYSNTISLMDTEVQSDERSIDEVSYTCLKNSDNMYDKIRSSKEVDSKFSSNFAIGTKEIMNNIEVEIDHELMYVVLNPDNPDLKSYKCKLCDFESKQLNSATKEHQLKHLNDKPYLCVVCCKAHNREYALRCHLTEAHNIKGSELEELMRTTGDKVEETITETRCISSLVKEELDKKIVGKNKDIISRVDSNKVLSANEFHRQLEPYAQSSIHENANFDVISNINERDNDDDSFGHNDTENCKTNVELGIKVKLESGFVLGKRVETSTDKSLVNEAMESDVNTSDKISVDEDKEMETSMIDTTDKTNADIEFNCDIDIGVSDEFKNDLSSQRNLEHSIPQLKPIEPGDESKSSFNPDGYLPSFFTSVYKMMDKRMPKRQSQFSNDVNQLMDVQNMSCLKCNKKCSNKSNLKQHIKFVHLNEKGFSCLICDKKFNTKFNLKIHWKQHSNLCDTNIAEKIQCLVCGKSFTTRSYLKVHLVNKHGIEKKQTSEQGKMNETTVVVNPLPHRDVI